MLRLLFILLMALPSLSIASQDEGLYPNLPPSNAAFVRVINQSGTIMNDVTLSGISLGIIKEKNVTDYIVAQSGLADIIINKKLLNHTLMAGQYYTVGFLFNDLIILSDQEIVNPTKAVIAFYNMSDNDNLSLVSTTHDVNIFNDINIGKKDSREINAIPIGVAIKNGDSLIKKITNIKLQRQMVTSIFVIGENGNYDVIIKNNTALK